MRVAPLACTTQNGPVSRCLRLATHAAHQSQRGIAGANTTCEIACFSSSRLASMQFAVVKVAGCNLQRIVDLKLLTVAPFLFAQTCCANRPCRRQAVSQ